MTPSSIERNPVESSPSAVTVDDVKAVVVEVPVVVPVPVVVVVVVFGESVMVPEQFRFTV